MKSREFGGQKMGRSSNNSSRDRPGDTAQCWAKEERPGTALTWGTGHLRAGDGTPESREPAELCESRLREVRRLFWKLHTAAGPQAHTLHTATRAHHSLMEKMPNV